MAHQPSDLRSWLILFLYIPLLIGVFCAEDLEFTIEPNNVVVFKERPFVWDCAAEGSSPINITWRKDDQAIQDDGHHLVLRNGSLYFATIEHKRRKESDEGIYKCFASNGIGTIVSREARLQVASKPKFVVQPEPVIAHIGDVARFSCSANSIPQAVYFWEKDRVSLPRSNRFISLPSGVLQIHNLQESDAGSYRCVSENVVSRRRSVEGSLTVQPASTPSSGNFDDDQERKPVIVAGPQNVTLLAGSTVVLECLAGRGSPTDFTPEVTWSKEGLSLSGRDRISYFGETNLKIEGLKIKDSGWYVCTATNTVTGAVVQARGKLEVHAPPRLKEVPRTVTRPVGGTARFSCSAEGEPQPVIGWLKNGEPVHINGRINQPELLGDLVISGVRSGQGERDDALYQCVATNSAGQVQASACLKIIVDGNSPSSPTGLMGMAAYSTSLRIQWTPSTAPENEPIIAYTVHITPAVGGREEQQAIDPYVTSHLIENLQPNSYYLIYVTAYTTKSVGDKSETIELKTAEDVPQEAPVFTLSSNSPTSIIVTWEPLAEELRNGEITGYCIYYHRRGVMNDVNIDVDRTTQEYTLGGLEANTVYSIKMSASTSVGEGPVSPYSDKRTASQDHTIPLAPKLELEKLNSTAVWIHWTLPTSNTVAVREFQLFYSEGDVAELTGPTRLNSDRSHYILSGLKPLTRYFVKLIAVYEDGYSNDASGDIKTEVTPPQNIPVVETPTPPVQVKGVVHSSSTATVTWLRPPQTDMEILFYTIRFQPSHVTNASVIRKEEIEGESATLTNLVPFTEYQIAVRAHGRNSVGPYSEDVTIRTPEDKPSSPPSNVKLSLADVQTVFLQWAPPAHPNGIITTYVILYSWDVEEPEDTWAKNEREGWVMNSTIGGLKPSLGYYFKMAARTGAGEGPASEPLHIRMPAYFNIATDAPLSPESTVTTGLLQQNEGLPQSGIIVGVSIGLGCIIVCIVFIVYRGRHGLLQLCKPATTCHVPAPACNGHIPHCRGNGYIGGKDYGKAHTEVELESFTPMLSQLPVPANMDTKGGNGTLINGYGPVGCHGSNHHLRQCGRLQDEPPGSSNTSISASTSSSSSTSPRMDGGLNTAPDESIDTSQIPEGNETMLTNLSSCQGDGEDPDAVTTDTACQAATHDTNCSCSSRLPQSSRASRISSSPPAQEEITGNLSNPRGGRAEEGRHNTPALLQNSSTQDQGGDDDVGVGHCHHNGGSPSPPLLPPGEGALQDSGTPDLPAPNNSATTAAGKDNSTCERCTLLPSANTHRSDCSGSDCRHSSSSNSLDNPQEPNGMASTSENGLSGDDDDSNASHDTSPYFIEIALNM